MLTKSSKMFTEQIFPIICHKNPNFELYFFQKRQMRTMRRKWSRIRNLIHESIYAGFDESRAVSELLGKKYICPILPARRESNTFPARRRDNDVSQQGRFRLIIAEGRKKKARVRPINYIINFYIKSCALLLNFTLFYVSQEGSVLRRDISKNSCRWLLLMNPE